jgi:hypothetical protein
MNDELCRTCFADAHVNGSKRPESWCLILTGGRYVGKECPFYKRAGTVDTMQEREDACHEYAATHSRSEK